MLIQPKGQGFIEIMIALLIIGVGIVALSRFQNNLIHSNDLVKQQNEANSLAVNQIETVRDYTTLVGYQGIASGSTTVTGVNATYTINWTVTPFTDPTYKDINLTVSWLDRNGTSQTIRLVTRVAALEPAFSADVM